MQSKINQFQQGKDLGLGKRNINIKNNEIFLVLDNTFM